MTLDLLLGIPRCHINALVPSDYTVKLLLKYSVASPCDVQLSAACFQTSFLRPQ